MDRIPFGISRFDALIGGGAPPGSVVLLAGEVGAGVREFAYTSITLNGLLASDRELFDLYYGDLSANARQPDSLHYVSLTDDRSAIETEMGFVLEDEIVDNGLETVEFADLSREYFRLSQVPTAWYDEHTHDITGLGERHDTSGVIETLGDYLTEHAAGSLLVIDSVTDLINAAGDEMEWSDVALLMKGLKKASSRWDGVVLLLVNVETLTDTELGTLMESTDGTLHFEWASGGSERARTMVVRRFRGVLSRLEAEDIVRFETDIHDGGFDISNVRKIR